MEVMSEKPRFNNGQDKKGKKTTKVELNLGKNGGILILLGGALVTALLSSAFRKQRKPREKDENHRGSPPPLAAEENGKEQKNNISHGEDRVSGDEDPVRKGLQFILSDPSSLMQKDHLRTGEGDYNASKEMNETVEKDGSVLKMQASEEQDSPGNGCHQEIISNDSSIPGSATSSEQEYSSQPFYSHPLFEQATLIKEGTLHTEDFREETVKAALEEEVKEMKEMEGGENNCSPEIEMDLCDGQNAVNSSPEMMQRNDEHRGVGGDDDGDQKNINSEQVTPEIIRLEDCEINVPSHIKQCNEVSTTIKENGNTNEPASAEQSLEEDIPIPTIQFVVLADEKALRHSSMEKEGEEGAGNDEEETIPYIHFAEKKLCEDGYKDDNATGKNHPVLPSNDKEGDETDDGDERDYDDECHYNDGDDDISEETEESSEAEGISSDESDDDGATWPAEPVQSGLMGLEGPNIKEETKDTNRTLKTEDYTNFKIISSSKQQTKGDLKTNSIQISARKLVILDNLVSYSLQSKRRILAGTFTLLVAYSCFWYFELPFLKPSLVVIVAMFLSKVLAF